MAKEYKMPSGKDKIKHSSFLVYYVVAMIFVFLALFSIPAVSGIMHFWRTLFVYSLMIFIGCYFIKKRVLRKESNGKIRLIIGMNIIIPLVFILALYFLSPSYHFELATKGNFYTCSMYHTPNDFDK